MNSVYYPLMQKKKMDGVGSILQNIIPISFYNTVDPVVDILYDDRLNRRYTYPHG